MSHLQRSERRGPTGPVGRTGPADAGTVSATITALTAHRALHALAALGADREVEARRVGVPHVEDPEFAWRVPLAAAEALFARGIALGGPDFPLACRTPRPEDNRSLVTMYCRTRRTGREAIEACCALAAYVTDGYGMSLEAGPAGSGWMRWHGAPRPAVWWFDAADLLANLKMAIPRGPWVTGLRAPFAAPPGAEALFGCRCEPAPTFAVRLSREVLEFPVPPVDPAIRAHIERQLADLGPPPSSGPSLIAALWSLGPTATAAQLASTTGLSERTLHRRLVEAGTTFRAELDGIRAAFAARAGDRPADELAELLGYSDVRAYRRASRRWRERTSPRLTGSAAGG